MSHTTRVALAFTLILAIIPGSSLRGEEAPPAPPAKKPQEAITLETLLQFLRGNGTNEQIRCMEDFAKQADAPKALPELLKVLQNEAPKMDNNICLAINLILANHPDADCPLEPLLETLQRKAFLSQQKGAQALCAALKPSNWTGREEELCRALIPLLTSQRSTVYRAALSCLQKFSGQAMGSDPDLWKAYYEKQYPGKTLDLSATAFELVLVIRPVGEKPPFTYDLNGKKLADIKSLGLKLAEHQASSVQHGLKVGAVLLMSDEKMKQMMATQDFSMIQEVGDCVQASGLSDGLTVSSETLTEFRPPYRPAAKPEAPATPETGGAKP